MKVAELGGAGGGRLDDEIFLVRAESAGTASRPARVQAGQADLVEPVDHIARGVLVGLDQLGDHRHPVPGPTPAASSLACSAPSWCCHGARCAAVSDRSVGEPRTGSATPPPAVGSDVTAHPTAMTTAPANLCGHSTSRHAPMGLWCASGQRIAVAADASGGVVVQPGTDRAPAGGPDSRLPHHHRHQGLPLSVGIFAADLHDSQALIPPVRGIPPIRSLRGPRRRRPGKLHGDKGYAYGHLRQWLASRGIRHRLARKGIESSRRLGQHRWVVERTVSWLAGCRRLHCRYERKPEHLLAFTVIAATLICHRRLAK